MTATDLKAELELKAKEINNLKGQIFKMTVKKLTPEEKVIQLKKEQAIKYKIKNGLSVEALRGAGNNIKIVHLRYTDVAGIPVLIPIPAFLRGQGYEFSPRGGVTYVMITNPANKNYTLVSVCHETDAFDYKLGVKHALELLSDEEASELVK